MNKLNSNNFTILDLPDEILLFIFRKLNMVDVFYSLVDVNQRFHRLAFDSVYIRDVNMTDIMIINSLYDHTSSVDTEIVSRVCSKILPRIRHQIQKLTIEEFSMKQILRVSNHPQLYSLSLINFHEETLCQYLSDDLILRDLLSRQITHLNIDIKKGGGVCSKTVSKIFALILSLCKNLIVLNFCDMFPTRQYMSPLFHLLSINYIPSTLVKLKISVVSLVDCLYLLDGPLVCLSTLIINVGQIFHPQRAIDPSKKLPRLKCLSFTVGSMTFEYDDLVVPLLCRMINLEELQLYLSVGRFESTYIDGVQLYNQFLIYMTQLHQFTFNIKTKVYNKNSRIGLPSNEDIQRSFNGRNYKEVASSVRTDLFHCDGECHIYSLPYEFEYFNDLNNSFQGGMFHKVRQLKMNDTIPFEYTLFKIISEDFSFLEYLYISNEHAQKDKQQSLALIRFPYLTLLDLQYAHVDYAELFLFKQNTHLPCLLNLSIQYKSIKAITNNFTIDAMYYNFRKLISLQICETFVRPENFCEYFPLL